MLQCSKDERLLSPPGAQLRFTAERLLRTRPKTYRAIVQLLADPGATIMHIAKRHRVSEHTVRAIRAREAVAIAERKQRLMSIFANVAEISAERMEELAGQANLRDAGTTAGIATDKLLALSGDPQLTIRHEHLHARLSDDDVWAYMIERSKRREKTANAEVIPQTHQLAEKTQRKKPV
jgi:transposase-like protein